MRENPEISVIIPVYGVSGYIEQCVASIRNQTIDVLYEIILVNDCTPDDSIERIQDTIASDTRILLVEREKNGGLSAARNSGIEVAKGKYIAFLDSDDWVEATFLEQLYQSIQTHGSDISVCYLRKEYDDGTFIADLTQAEGFGECIDVAYSPSALLALDAYAHNKLYAARLFHNTNVRFPEGLLYEDIGTFPLLFFQADRVSIVREPLLHYLTRPEAITTVFSLRGLDYLDSVEQVLEKAKAMDLKAMAPLEKAYRVQHCFYSLVINIGYIPESKEREQGFRTLQSYLLQHSIRWGDIRDASHEKARLFALRGRAKRWYYRMFWFAYPLLVLILRGYHKFRT